MAEGEVGKRCTKLGGEKWKEKKALWEYPVAFMSMDIGRGA